MRWLDPEITVAPTAQAVDLATAKAHLRVDDTASDDLISAYLASAQGYVEAATGLRLAEQTVKLRAYGFDCRDFRLPAAPVQSIVSIKYLDPSGDEQTLDPGAYRADLYGIHPALSLATNAVWPAHRVEAGAVTIEAVCGYAEGEAPTPLAQAILLIVGDWFANRETTDPNRVQAIEMVAVDALLANYRRAFV